MEAVSTETPYVLLDIKGAFDGLTAKEKLYAHHISEASWMGSLATVFQISAESPALFRYFVRMFSAASVADMRARVESDQPSMVVAFDALTDSAAQVLGNMGNYLSFGDSKFVPSCPQAHLAPLCTFLEATYMLDGKMDASLLDSVYCLDHNVKSLGLPPNGVSTYYGGAPYPTEEEIDIVDNYLNTKKTGDHCYNTRVFRAEKRPGWTPAPGALELRVAAADTNFRQCVVHKGVEIHTVRGDYAPAMGACAAAIEAAVEHAANPNQVTMLEKYAEHFRTGDIVAHKDAQRSWIKDIGPVVETNIGFVESYRDPKVCQRRRECLP
jgi:dipeptidyl-peptidase-3